MILLVYSFLEDVEKLLPVVGCRLQQHLCHISTLLLRVLKINTLAADRKGP